MTAPEIRTKPIGWVIAAAAATATVFAIDLLVPRGIAVPMLYVLPILLTWLAPGLQSTILVGGAAVAGTWIRVWLSTNEFAHAGFTNRTMVSAMLLVVAGLLVKQKQVSRQVADVLREVNAELEQRVKERTGELAEANERWGLVMRATNDGVWDWDVLHDRVSFSPRWKAMHGFDEQDGLESSKVWSESIHPEDRARVMKKLEDYWKHQQSEFWEEYRMQRKDGTWMWVLDRGVSVWDEQGRVVRMVGAETDITWRKEAEEALGRREHEFRTLADNVPAFFSYVDKDRRYRFVNKRYEELFQRPGDQIVGLTMQELLGPEGYAVVQPHLEASFGGQEVSFEYPLVIPGGGQHWFSARYMPDRDGQGRVIGLFILFGDVTTLKLSEADLRKKERALRDLNARLLQAQEEERRRIAQELHDDFTQRLASLAIDLRTVQRSMSGLDPLSVSWLQQLGDSAEHLATDLQQVAHQLHPSILEHVGLEAAVREQVEEFAQRTGLKAEIIVRQLPPAVPHEQALCLYRVLQESLRNVQKHAGATNVLVRLLQTNRGVGLCVHDDGRGIENLEGSTRRKGLGVISMEERVGALGGRFRIRTKPGDGTEIHAWVPLGL